MVAGEETFWLPQPAVEHHEITRLRTSSGKKPRCFWCTAVLGGSFAEDGTAWSYHDLKQITSLEAALLINVGHIFIKDRKELDKALKSAAIGSVDSDSSLVSFT